MVCDDALPVAACDQATLSITILDANRDYGDAPANYPTAWHRALYDVNNDQVPDGETDIWLGDKADFETSQQSNETADSDLNDDAMSFGSNSGDFPMSALPGTEYIIDLTVNSNQADLVYFGLWIDWNEDGSYEDFYQGSQVTASPATAQVTITTPTAIGDKVNVRLRADDQAFVPTDFAGAKANGEVEDYQPAFLLPLDLERFEAQVFDCNVLLQWTTSEEKDFSHFIVEKSEDGRSFSQLTKLFAQGGFDAINQYQYLYEYPMKDKYFRLKMVNDDGSFIYSSVLFSEAECRSAQQLLVYPNPVFKDRPQLTVAFFAESARAELQITNALGKEVKRIPLAVDKGFSYRIPLDVAGLPAGSYALRLIGNDEPAQLFVIQE